MHRVPRDRRAGFAVLVIAAAQLVVQAVAPAPAFAAGQLGVVLVATTLDDYDDRHNSNSTQTRSATCPSGTHVIGGGARVSGGGDEVRLTRLVPVRGGTGQNDSYSATAEEPDTGYASEWQFVVYALCADADELDGYSVVSGSTSESSSAFKQATADCPGATLAIGGGAAISNGDHQVGLQLSRLAAPLDIARATGREDANGFALNWSVTAYAICANRIGGAAIYGTLAAEGDTSSCPPDKFTYSVGGGGSLTDSGAYFLQTLYPFGDRSWTVEMTGPPIGQTSVQALCGY
ncbi:hypothetical protein ACQP00_32850 [Dactylosporangium sp. CS-047395]|uniref:hypothetical protein n=1 Tax=Dactylosporangium sp. CS-047395 TaxID=3239936 RepID=UPI003D916387